MFRNNGAALNDYIEPVQIFVKDGNVRPETQLILNKRLDYDSILPVNLCKIFNSFPDEFLITHTNQF